MSAYDCGVCEDPQYDTSSSTWTCLYCQRQVHFVCSYSAPFSGLYYRLCNDCLRDEL